MHIQSLRLVFFLTFVVSIFTPVSASSPDLDDYTSNLPFVMPPIKLPVFPSRIINIKDFGALGDGHTTNTEAFANAIAACAQAGGGRVLVPPGIWLTGPIRLASKIELHLDRGAVIVFTGRFEDYPLVRTSFEGAALVRCTSPISAVKAEDIAITGEGIIDGSGQAWRPVKKSKLTAGQWKQLLASGGAVGPDGSTWWPSVQALNGAASLAKLYRSGNQARLEDFAVAREFLRPVMVSLVECRRVLLDGPTFQNSPAWNIHPLLCEDLVIRNVTVLNPWYSQNGDGLDLDSCRRAVVYNCRFDVGDDAICIKSGKDEYGRRRGRACEQVVIADCVVYHGHGGFTVGSEMSGGVRDMVVRDCTFLGTDVGLRFKSQRGRGGVVENIYISNIQMKDIPTDAIGFNLFYSGAAPDEQGETGSIRPARPVDEGTPQFRKIFFKDITCTGAERAVVLEGLPEMPIRDITLENVLISSRLGFQAFDAEDITLKNVRILSETGPAFSLTNARKVGIEKASCKPGAPVFLKVSGAKTADVQLAQTDLGIAAQKIERSAEVPVEAVREQ
jgi:polygalacturonase